jgi:DcuC family C4-dicarboxylate transporter
MVIAGPIIALVCIVIVARLLLKKAYPHAVLLSVGMFMLIMGFVFQLDMPDLKNPTGFQGFDLFRYISETFSQINARVGLMIMAIGGFVAYIDHIGASDTLVNLAIKPLHALKRHPNLAAVFVIPLGQLLFVCIPSAAGLGLLLMASVFPILLKLGVSRLSAVSVITATTAFGIGPASAITASAVGISGEKSIEYFLQHQLPVVIPLNLVLMLVYFFTNRYFDKKEKHEENGKVHPKDTENSQKAPLIYAVIPVLPLILLIAFSEIFSFFPRPISLDTTTAMFISLAIAMIFEFFRYRSLHKVLLSLKIFWEGMGNIFKSVVTLIIAADIFAKGLIALGFIEGLVLFSQHLGFGYIGIGIVLTALIFLASMMMGSGNASFFAFGPLVPEIALKFGVKSTVLILPMNLAASMGRTVSPVAGVIIAVSEIAGVTTMQVVKRNLIPLTLGFIVLLILNFV